MTWFRHIYEAAREFPRDLAARALISALLGNPTDDYGIAGSVSNSRRRSRWNKAEDGGSLGEYAACVWGRKSGRRGRDHVVSAEGTDAMDERR